MSEFGNETATAVFKTGEKSIEALLQLLKFLMERNNNKAAQQLKKEQLKGYKADRKQQNIDYKASTKVGYMRASQLLKSGEKLQPISTTLSDKELKQFEYYAKKYGVLYTSISDKYNQNEKKERIILVRQKDLSKVKDITDRMNENIKLKSLDELINEINNKPIKTEEDLEKLNQYNMEKDKIIREGTREFNSENAEIIFKDVCGELQNESMSFDRSLNRITDRDFSRDKPYFTCERTNPTSYIELNSTLDTFNSKEYTRTDYKIFNNGEEKTCDNKLRTDGKFTDERFSGRPKDFWQSLKNDMKAKGGFSDDMVILNSKEELEKYQQLYKETINKRSSHENVIQVETDSQSYRDYAGIVNQLKEQLREYNMELSDENKLVDCNTKEDITNKDKTCSVADGINIEKQINNYNKMNTLQTDIAMKQHQYDMNEKSIINNTIADDPKQEMYIKIQSELKSEISKLEISMKECIASEKYLNTERNKLSGVYAEQQVDREYVEQQGQFHATELGKDEVSDNSRIDDEFEQDTMDMSEWKEQIAQDRQAIEISQPGIEINKNISKSAPSNDERG